MRTTRYLVPALLAMVGLASAQDFGALSSCAVGELASHVLFILQSGCPEKIGLMTVRSHPSRLYQS